MLSLYPRSRFIVARHTIALVSRRRRRRLRRCRRCHLLHEQCLVCVTQMKEAPSQCLKTLSQMLDSFSPFLSLASSNR